MNGFCSDLFGRCNKKGKRKLLFYLDFIWTFFFFCLLILSLFLQCSLAPKVQAVSSSLTFFPQQRLLSKGLPKTTL